VACFAERRRSRHEWSESRYRTVHIQLLRCCRELAAQSDHPKRDLGVSLESLVQPWLTAQSLAKTDGEILASLLASGWTVEQQLFDRKPWPAWIRRAWIAALFAAVALMLVALLLQFGGRWDIDPWIQSRLLWLHRTLGLGYELLLASLVVSFFAVYLVMRTSR
jgi:hypothetical protein